MNEELENSTPTNEGNVAQTKVRNSVSAPRSPGYYVKKRLTSNFTAMFGLVCIVIATIVAILGYHIMPDNTRKANDGDPAIQKLDPGVEVKIMKIMKTDTVIEQSFLTRLFSGKDRNYTILPVDSVKIVGQDIHAYHIKPKSLSHLHRRKSRDPYKTFSLLKVVRSHALGEHSSSVVTDKNEEFTYRDAEGEEVTTTLNELEKEFFEKNLIVRKYYLGTDKSGRDILSMLILGTRVSLGIGFIAVVISITLGVILGALAGFFGGWVDDVIQWLITVFWSIPGIMLVIAMGMALESKGIWVAFVAVGLIMWVDVARVVRGEIMSIKQKNFIESARALGFRNARIIFKHIIPNILGSLVVIANANFAAAILLEASLSFLGFGVQPPMPSWGSMVYQGYTIIGTSSGWGLVLFPGLCIMLLVLSFNLLGNGLRDAYDPKSGRT